MKTAQSSLLKWFFPNATHENFNKTATTTAAETLTTTIRPYNLWTHGKYFLFEALRQWGETPASPTPGWHLEQAQAQAQTLVLVLAEAEAEAI